MNKPTQFQQDIDTMMKERKVATRATGAKNANAERDHEYRLALLDHDYRLALLDHEWRMRKLELMVPCEDLPQAESEFSVTDNDVDDISIEEVEEIEKERELESDLDIDPDYLEEPQEKVVLRPAKPRRKLESVGASMARNDWSKDRSHLVDPKPRKLIPRAQAEALAMGLVNAMRNKPKAKRD